MNYITNQENSQPYYYAPNPDEVAYVTHDDDNHHLSHKIVVSPMRYSPRGLWYEDDLTGRWKSQAMAQAALDDLAYIEGWPLIAALNEERLGHDEY